MEIEEGSRVSIFHNWGAESLKALPSMKDSQTEGQWGEKS